MKHIKALFINKALENIEIANNFPENRAISKYSGNCTKNWNIRRNHCGNSCQGTRSTLTRTKLAQMIHVSIRAKCYIFFYVFMGNFKRPALQFKFLIRQLIINAKFQIDYINHIKIQHYWIRNDQNLKCSVILM